MKRIRVLLGDMPRILRELIDGAIAETADMTVVGAVDSRERVASSLERTMADVLIIGAPDDAASVQLQSLLYMRPRLRLVTIGHDGRSTALHQLRPFTVSLGDVSPDVLLDAIRASARGED